MHLIPVVSAIFPVDVVYDAGKEVAIDNYIVDDVCAGRRLGPFFSSHCLIPTLGDQGETYRQITCGYSFDSERGYICPEYVY